MKTEAEFKQEYSSLTADQMLDMMYEMYLANYSLNERINSARRNKFGSKSEHVSEDQLSLFNEAEFITDHSPDELDTPADDNDDSETNVKTRKKKKRKDHMKDLPVRTTNLYPDGIDVKDHKYKELAPERIRVVHYQRGGYYVEEIVCHKYAQDVTDKDGQEKTIFYEVSKDKKPARLIENSTAAPELPAHFAYEKYILCLPFDRIAKDLHNKGIPFSKQYICQVVIRCGEDYLKLMVERMTKDLRQCHVLNMDETELEVLEWLRKEGRRDCRIWGALTGPFEKKQMAVFYYNKTREHSFIYDILGTEYHGVIQSDGYQAYTNYKYAQMKVGCMAHARRKFFDALTADSKIYKAFKKAKRKEKEDILVQYPRFADIFKMVAKMDKLFDIERKLKEEHADPERIKAVRNEKAKPIMDEIHEYNHYLKNRYLMTGKLGDAVTYLNNQWEYLMNYLKDGEVALSNNLAEREGMKPIVMARKNFLFADTERGATVSAYYFSMLISARLNHLDPERYLTYVFQELSTYGLRDDVIERVLPYSDKLPAELKIKDKHKSPADDHSL